MSDWADGNWSGSDNASDVYYTNTVVPMFSDIDEDPTGTAWLTSPWFTDIGEDPTGTGTPEAPTGIEKIFKSISKLLSGTSPLGKTGAVLGAAGIGSLLNKLLGSGGTPGGTAGYRGGVPEYTATFTQTPIAQQRPANYRPGQGGITYFNPIQYTPTGRNITAPQPAPTPTPITTPQPTTTPQPAGYTEPPSGMRAGGIAALAHGGASRFLRGGGDGTSDSIRARFTESGAPAALADGEFVIDARTVSEIGNGSSEAGARKLYAMMDRVHRTRRHAQRGEPSGADKHLPA